jgi:hypothetical protein
MKSLDALKKELIRLLRSAGFDADLYYITIEEASVSVHFDDHGAVEYFKKEIEQSEIADAVIFEYRREGKRHIARFQLW